MMGFFISCLIILMAVMFISTVYCCFGVSSSYMKLGFAYVYSCTLYKLDRAY